MNYCNPVQIHGMIINDYDYYDYCFSVCFQNCDKRLLACHVSVCLTRIMGILHECISTFMTDLAKFFLE